MSNKKEIDNINQLEQIIASIRKESLLNAEEKNLKTKNNVCKKFIHKGCENNNCPFLHDLSKVRVCTNFMNYGNCAKGDLCDFSHKTNSSSINNGFVTCRQFQDFGYCENGESCPYKHAKRICRNYERGFCQLGTDCPDIHQEIKNPCPNYFIGFCPKGPNCKFFQ